MRTKIKAPIQKLALLGGPKVRKTPFKSHPVLGKEEVREVMSVLKTGALSGFVAKAGDAFLGGAQVKRLEKLFCDHFGVAHAIAMNSATSALHAALYAVGVEPGDEVIVPPYTMSASASAVVMCGGLPVFVDIGDDFCLDPSLIEAHITPKTKAILVVHLFGHPARMKEIMAIAKKHGLSVVEDCAQAPAAKDGMRWAGVWGDVGVYSLNQHKTITTGEGGVAVTNDASLALKMQLVRNHGEVVHDHIAEAKDEPVLGWNYRMTELEASVGIAQFKKLEKLTQHRIRLAQELHKLLKGNPVLTLPAVRSGCRHVYFLFVMLFDEKKAGIPRSRFVKAIAAEGIPLAEGYVRPIYLEPMYQKKRIFARSSFPFNLKETSVQKDYRRGLCPRTESLHERSLIATGLCRYPLTQNDMRDIAKAIWKVTNSLDDLRVSA